MNNPGNIEKKVEEALASIDSIGRAKANPFLYGKIIASMKEEKREWTVFDRPVIAFASVLVIILMNSLVFLHSSDNTPATTQEDEQIFAKEYNYPQTTADRFYSENDEQQ
jgi:hypothetical protein